MVAVHHGAVGSARQHRLMQNETRQTTTAAAFGRSSIARLPPTLREAVDAAIADGATIDEITARIRAEGGACSRSAVGRYTKNVRDLIRQQQEADRANEAWVRALGARAQGRAGLILIETLRTLVLSTLADLSRREERRPRRKSSPAWRWFSSASKAPTSSASSGSGRRRRQPGPRPARARQAGQEGPLARGRRRHPRGRRGEAPAACARRHIGAGRPVESRGLPLIPVNPT